MDAVAKRLACSRDVEAVCRVCTSSNAICAHRELDADDDYCTRESDVRDEHRAWPEDAGDPHDAPAAALAQAGQRGSPAMSG